MSDSLSPLSPLSLSLFLSIQSSFVFLCSSYLSVLIAFCSVHLSLRFASHTTYVRWHMPPIFTKLFGQLCTQFSANRTMPAPHWVQTDSVPGQDRQPEIAHASALPWWKGTRAVMVTGVYRGRKISCIQNTSDLHYTPTRSNAQHCNSNHPHSIDPQKREEKKQPS